MDEFQNEITETLKLLRKQVQDHDKYVSTPRYTTTMSHILIVIAHILLRMYTKSLE